MRTTPGVPPMNHSPNDGALFACLLETALEGVVVTDATQRILQVNSAFSRITGYSAAEVVGRSPRVLRSGLHGPDFFRAMWHALDHDGAWSGEIWNRRKSGEVYAEVLNIRAARDSQGRTTHYIGMFTDITAAKQSQAALERMAHYDALTRLPNRSLLIERLEHALTRRDIAGTRVAVLLVDLDDFKYVNDTLGLSAGDQLLATVAERIAGTIRREDTLARLGADEFAVLIEGIGDGRDVVGTIERTLQSVRERIEVEHHHLYTSASVGIAVFPEDGRDARALLQAADIAMHRAKELGKGHFQFYTNDLNIQARERLVVESNLHRALQEGELYLEYQPQVDLRTGTTLGVEALIRWNSAALGPMSPSRFIPIAEQTGLIVPIGDWVFRTAAKQARAWADAGTPMVVSVNVSARQFRKPDFLASIERGLADANARPDQLLLELTESSLADRPTEARRILIALRNLGFRLAIDDFGTGYSSLAYLKSFPLDQLKIDRGFVRDILVDKDDAAITRATIALAHSLSLHVVAEGVETADQADYLRKASCELAQGYLFARPCAPDLVRDRYVA